MDQGIAWLLVQERRRQLDRPESRRIAMLRGELVARAAARRPSMVESLLRRLAARPAPAAPRPASAVDCRDCAAAA